MKKILLILILSILIILTSLFLYNLRSFKLFLSRNYLDNDIIRTKETIGQYFTIKAGFPESEDAFFEHLLTENNVFKQKILSKNNILMINDSSFNKYYLLYYKGDSKKLFNKPANYFSKDKYFIDSLKFYQLFSLRNFIVLSRIGYYDVFCHQDVFSFSYSFISKSDTLILDEKEIEYYRYIRKTVIDLLNHPFLKTKPLVNYHNAKAIYIQGDITDKIKLRIRCNRFFQECDFRPLLDSLENRIDNKKDFINHVKYCGFPVILFDKDLEYLEERKLIKKYN